MIYFDNAATTPVLYSCDLWGNPSSPHARGIEAERAFFTARGEIAEALGCDSEEVVFTSGGTESNNLAIFGASKRFVKRGGHIISTPYEHPSVSRPIKSLADAGVGVTFVPAGEIIGNIREETFLVSLVHINNETGDVNEIERIAAEIKKTKPEILVHSDGAQAFGKVKMNLCNIDLYSYSSHKIHGPAGVGGLMLKRGVKIQPLFFGGDQQRGLRPGTENLSGAVSTAEAAKRAIKEFDERIEKVMQINGIVSSLAGELPDTHINCGGGRVSPYILNMSFCGIKSETLVHALSDKGICVSNASACHSKTRGKSSILDAMGFGRERSESAVRFSFSHLNTREDAEAAKEIVASTVNSLRGRVKSK